MILCPAEESTAILINMPVVYYIELEEIFQKYIWNHKIYQISPEIFRKKSKVGDGKVTEKS